MRETSALLLSFILQVCVGQEKKFNFPQKMRALRGSCVEIPCSSPARPEDAQNSKVVWHVQLEPLGQRVIYSTDVSQISLQYRNRAELVRGSTGDCTLRIHNVKKEDEHSYHPQERKVSLIRRVSAYVQLEVTDRPPEPILSVPGEMTIGESTTITCMANYTCASSPPTFTWNHIGPSVTERSDLGEGKWGATSKLTYTPAEADNGSLIQCTVTYFGGQMIKTMRKVNIRADQKTNPYIGPVIGVACGIFILAIVFIIWRKRDSWFSRKKAESGIKMDPTQNTSYKNNTRYTDLLERPTSSYYTVEPTSHNHRPRQGRNAVQSPENEAIYEDMSIKYTNQSRGQKAVI